MSLQVREFYKNKTLFLTGCTGFVGKVLLYKLIQTSEPKIIYLMIRGRKGMTVEQRLEKEIYQSKMFLMQNEEFIKKARSMIRAVEADITEDFLFTGDKAKENRQLLANEIDVIIHCAAVVSFFERLDIAINMNVWGTMRVLRFAHECKRLCVFNYISTMYANSHQQNGSTVYEKLYTVQLPNNEDIEAFCKRVSGSSDSEIERIQKDTVRPLGFPNTYTFTKNMTERLVDRYRGNLSVCICRPSIVGSSYRDPVPGWVDTVSAAGGIYFFMGLGYTTVMWLDDDAISDQIPVDYVCNGIIAACVETANTKDFKIFALGSSNINPVTWGEGHRQVLRYFQTHRPKKSKIRAHTKIIKRKNAYKTHFLLDNAWSNKLYSAYAKTFGSKEALTKSELLSKMEAHTLKINKNYSFFCTHSWRFDNSNYEKLRLSMDQVEQDLFLMDLKKIDWHFFFSYFCWGLHTYIMGEKPSSPFDTNIVDKDDRHPGPLNSLSDVNFAINAKSSFLNKRSKQELQKLVLSSSLVRKEIQEESTRTKKSISEIEAKAKEITEGMFADPSPNHVRTLSYLLRKIWRRLYDQIIVDEKQVLNLKKIQKDPKSGSIIFIPTHRSYIDFLIISYVFFTYDLPMPHIAAGEDFLGMFLVRDLFRYSGAFFLRRSFTDDSLYKSIFQEYVQQLLSDGCPLEFFVEGTRSRAGKTLQPKLGLLNIIAETLLSDRISNVTIVPINISYERILESEAYSRELRGESKTKESLSNLIKARNVINKKYGDIYINFSDPINLKDYIEKERRELNCPTFDPRANSQDKFQLVRDLGYNITYSLNRAAVIMPTSIVATLLLRNREGLGKDELIEKVISIKNIISQKGGRVHWNYQVSDTVNVERSLQLLGNVILTSDSVIEPNVRKEKEWERYILLGNTRNGLLHFFVSEAILSTAHHSVESESVSRLSLLQRAEFLRNLLHVEFIYHSDDRVNEQELESTLASMIKRGYFVESQGQISVPTEGMEMYSLFCSMLWSFIDTYWIAATTILALNGNAIEPSMLLGRVHWLCEKLYRDGKILFYETSSMDTVKNTIQTFLNSQILKRIVKNGKPVYEVVPSQNDLSDLCDRIKQFRTEKSRYKSVGLSQGRLSQAELTIRQRIKNKLKQMRSNL